MILYHGSKQIIEEPNVKGSNPHNDYGPAFYLTSDLEAAKSWACRHDEVGIVNKYRVSDQAYRSLRVLDLTDKSKYSVLHWLAVLMHFRHLEDSFRKRNALLLDWLRSYDIDLDAYDAVIGYRADDAYFRLPLRFLSNDLAYEDLEEAFLLGHLGVQIAFLSKRAISSLRFLGTIPCEVAYVGSYHALVSEATGQFDALLEKERDPSKTYILDLMRERHE